MNLLDRPLNRRLDRREFAASVAGAALRAASPAAAGSMVWLEAIIAPRLPHRIAIGAAALPKPDSHGIFELRSYAHPRASRNAAQIIAQLGWPVARHETGFLIAFDSCASRDRAWREFIADHRWSQTREVCDTSYQFAIFRRA